MTKKKTIKEERLDKFHFHEALDRTAMIQSIIENELYKHPAIVRNRKYKKLIDKAQVALGQLYQTIGAEH